MSTAPVYFPDVQIAEHFGTTIEALDFVEDAWFAGAMQACTVKVAGTYYDVWFANGKISQVVVEA